jgi:hypothetical protein
MPPKSGAPDEIELLLKIYKALSGPVCEAAGAFVEGASGQSLRSLRVVNERRKLP